MAYPVADTYSAASGQSIYGGIISSYNWARSLTADAFTELSGTSFSAWASANIPAGAYQGSAPYDSIVNAFCDPGYDAANGAQYFFGGGHGDGTCNGVFKFNHSTLKWSTSFSPTPPSKYPPSYYNGGTNQPGLLIYPSGLDGGGYFQDALTDPADVAYATPYARASSHMYAAAAVRGQKVHYFYGNYGVYDFGAGAWEKTSVNLGAQIYAINSNYASNQLQQGTVAIYDDVTDRFFVTLVPGDAGLSWRSGIITFNAASGLIESITDAGSYGTVLSSVNLCKAGREIYIFTKVAASYLDPQNMSQGFIFNMDTKGLKKFTIVGDVSGTTYLPSTDQETIPSYYDGVAIRRWNFQTSEKAKIYSLNLTPESGDGSLSSPYVLRQTVRNLSGAVPASPTFIYSRLVWDQAANCAIVIPRSTANFVAIKLA